MKDYLSAMKSPPENSPLSLNTFRLIVGTTREEIDFAPGDDVSNFSEERFRDFVYDRVSDGFGHDVASKTVSRYLLNDNSTSKQQTYAQIVSDATIWCPTMYLLDAANETLRSQFYVYQTSQKPGHAFCPLGPFQMIPNYCPEYSFHAIDMFMMFQVRGVRARSARILMPPVITRMPICITHILFVSLIYKLSAENLSKSNAQTHTQILQVPM